MNSRWTSWKVTQCRIGDFRDFASSSRFFCLKQSNCGKVSLDHHTVNRQHDLQSRKLNQQATVSYSGCSTVTGWRTLLVMPNKPFLPKPFLPISRSIRWASSISSTSFVRRALISFSAEAATPWYFRHLASNLVIRSPWSAAQPNLQNYHPAQTY